MGLFSFKKSPSVSDDFAFRIDDVFSIKGQGVVVTGQVISGELHKGGTVVCAAADGHRFPCTVFQIEQTQAAGQSGRLLCPDTASADGPFEGHYALGIAERIPHEFHPGDQLISGKE